MQNYLLGRLMLDLEGISLTDEEKDILLNPHVGGVILFTRNIISRQQVKSLCMEIASINPWLLIATDQEGGKIQRLKKGYSILPSMRQLALNVEKNANQDFTFTAEIGWLMASEVIASGLDISFAPVLDLDLATSSIIGDRSFGDNPKTVINIADSFIKGMNEAGMQAVGKHFPGHGGIHADTHLVCSEDQRLLAELERHDLLPFNQLHNRLGGIMTAHIAFPKINKDIATFSEFWLKDILRKKIKYTGVIFSDDLSMKGADAVGGIEAKTQKAFESGCTMILICNDRTGACKALDFMEKQGISQSKKLFSLKASKSISWEGLEIEPRRLEILERLKHLNSEMI